MIYDLPFYVQKEYHAMCDTLVSKCFFVVVEYLNIDDCSRNKLQSRICTCKYILSMTCAFSL